MPQKEKINRYYFSRFKDGFTNYDYMHFRFYASSMGRFLKPDNIIPDITNPQNWNAYTYVKGNPVNYNDPSGHTEDQPLQQENKQNQPVGPTQPSTQNIEAMKTQEQKMVDQPKKVGDELKEPLPPEVEEMARATQKYQQEDTEHREFSAMVAYDEEGNVYKTSSYAIKPLSPKEKIEGKIEGTSSLSGPTNELFNIQKETGVKFTKVYAIHSHPSDTSPTYPTDYNALAKLRNYEKNNRQPFKDAQIIGIVATPERMFIYNERKYKAQPYKQ